MKNQTIALVIVGFILIAIILLLFIPTKHNYLGFGSKQKDVGDLILKIDTNGSIYLRGELIAQDKELGKALKNINKSEFSIFIPKELNDAKSQEKEE